MSDASRRTWWLATALAALVVVVYADPLLERRVFVGRDLIPYNLPMEKSVHRAWAAGELPLWTPEISGGRPLAPNPNVGAFYPLRILLSRFSFPAAARIYPALHWTASGVGMLLLLCAIGVSVPGAWIGAVSYAFSGVAVSESFFPHIQPGMALLPWILWSVARPARSAARGILRLALLFALNLLAADVFTVALGLACAALWIATEAERSAQFRKAGSVAAAFALALLAAAPQIIATALWIPETNRGVLGMKLADATLYSVSPWRLTELVVPYPFGPVWQLDIATIWGWRVTNYRGMGLFATLSVGALAVVAVATMWRRRAPGVRFARSLLVFSLALCVLPSLLPAAWGQIRSPLPLRNPEKLAVAAVLALAILAARAFDVYRSERRRPRGMIAVGALMAAAAAVTAAWPEASGRIAANLVGGSLRFPERAAAALPQALAEAGLFWMSTAIALDLAARGGRARTLAAVGLLTLVPIAAHARIADTAPEREALGPTPFAMRLSRADPAGVYRTLGAEIYRSAPRGDRSLDEVYLGDVSERTWVNFTQLLWGRGTVFNTDFDAGDLSRVESLRRVSPVAFGFPDPGTFFGNLALAWSIRYRVQAPVPGYRRVGADAIQDFDEVGRAYPDIRLATAWREEPGAIDALRALPELTPGELVLETGRKAHGTARPGKIRILQKSPVCLRLETDAPDPTWLFVLRGYWSHRSVSIDDREVEPVPAYLGYSAVPVPAGRHRVAWCERLPGGRVSRFGPPLFGMIAVAILVFDRRRRTS